MNRQRGNCYVVTEAARHILGREWKPMVMRVRGGTHWFLKHRNGTIVDLSRRQFATAPDYTRARGCGFLTRRPSKAARALMQAMTWKRGARC